jgi:hypothetical protein
MLWADTGTGYLKQRNGANNAWVAIQPLDPSVPLSTNAGNAYSITLSPAITAYVGGVVYKFLPNAASTGAATLSINGLAAIPISLAGIQANQPLFLVYDATDVLFLALGIPSAPAAPVQGVPHGMQLFTSSGTWNLPSGITKVWVIAIGGAGSQNNGSYVEGIIAVSGNATVTVGAAGQNSSFAGSTTLQADYGNNGGSGGSIIVPGNGLNNLNVVCGQMWGQMVGNPGNSQGCVLVYW